MPAIASLEDLIHVRDDLSKLKDTYPEAYTDFQLLFKHWRVVGYKNISKLMLEETTPEKLKRMAEIKAKAQARIPIICRYTGYTCFLQH